MPAEAVALAAHHAGLELKNLMKDEIARRGLQVIDLGTYDATSVDYPDMADRLAAALDGGQAQRGILVCGIRISIAANRHRHVRAALCHDVTNATLARQHNDANVLVLGARIVGAQTAVDSLGAFLDTAFEGDRHRRRVDKLG